MISVHDVLRRNAFLSSFDGDGNPMLVRAADEKHFFAFEAQIAGVDICRYIHSGKMTDVYGTIRIGQGCRDEGAFELF